MSLNFLPSGKVFNPFSERYEPLKIYLFDKLSKTMFEEYIYDLPYAVNVFVGIPEF